MRTRAIATVVGLALATRPAAAAEGTLLDVNLGLAVWTVVIFLIVLAVLWKFAYPKILGAVEARERYIEELVAAAERDRAEAQALLAQQRRELEEARRHAQALVADARRAAEDLRQEILQRAQEESRALLERARQEMRAERQALWEELRREAADLVVEAAERVLGRTVNRDDTLRLAEAALASTNGANTR